MITAQILFFLAFDFCRFCVVIRVFFIPATMTNDLRLRRIFYPRFYPLHLFSYLNSWERVSIFPFDCSVLNKGTTGTIFITSLVWRSPWLGIEPGTSRTRSQHYTTSLSRRRQHNDYCTMIQNTNVLILVFVLFTGRTLVFGNVTGVNLHGEVVLGSEDVRTEWIRVKGIYITTMN